MPTDRSLESLRAEVEELRARFARMQADDRDQRRAMRRGPTARPVEEDCGRRPEPFPSGSSA
jgi:hypothetical protein